MSVGKKSPARQHIVDKNGWVSYCIKIKIDDMERINKVAEFLGEKKTSVFLREILLENIKNLEAVLCE